MSATVERPKDVKHVKLTVIHIGINESAEPYGIPSTHLHRFVAEREDQSQQHVGQWEVREPISTLGEWIDDLRENSSEHPSAHPYVDQLLAYLENLRDLAFSCKPDSIVFDEYK